MHKSSANALPVSFCPLWGFFFLPFCAPRISDWKESIKRSKILKYSRVASVLKLICILDLSRDAPGNGFPLKIKIWLWIRRRQIRLDTRNSRVFILYTFASLRRNLLRSLQCNPSGQCTRLGAVPFSLQLFRPPRVNVLIYARRKFHSNMCFIYVVNAWLNLLYTNGRTHG